MPLDYKPYINKKLDGRIKITSDQYNEVKADYKRLKSYRKTAKLYGVSKKIIQFIIKPETKKRDEARRKRGKVWLKYYDKDKHTLAIRKYRAKKRKHNLQYTRKQIEA